MSVPYECSLYCPTCGKKTESGEYIHLEVSVFGPSILTHFTADRIICKSRLQLNDGIVTVV